MTSSMFSSVTKKLQLVFFKNEHFYIEKGA